MSTYDQYQGSISTPRTKSKVKGGGGNFSRDSFGSLVREEIYEGQV